MKILMIPNSPFMGARHYRLSKALRAQGHEIVYFVPALPYGLTLRQHIKHFATSLLPNSYTYEGFVVHKAIRLPYFWPLINGLIFRTQLRHLYRHEKADFVITETYTNETRVPKNIPFVYDIVDDYAAPGEIYGSRIYQLAFKVLGIKHTMQRQTTDARAVIVVSDLLSRYAHKYNDDVYTIDNGVDKEVIEDIQINHKQTRICKHSIVYVSNFGPWSGIPETLHAVRELRKTYPDITLTLAGEGTEVPKILDFIRQYNAEEYIDYRGFIGDRKKLFSLIEENAIGLNISDKNKWRDAAQPIKVLEYSAMGKKIVSTNLREVVKLNFPTIYLFAGKSGKNSLRVALETALKDKPSKKVLLETSQYVLDRYNWEKSARDLSVILSGLKESSTKKAPIRAIVHVTSSYPPALGGLEKVVEVLARTQASQGLHTSVLTSNRSSQNSGNTGNVAVTRLKSFVIANTTIIPGLLPELLKIKRSKVVHLHIAQAYTPEMVLLAAKIKRFSYIAHIHLDVPASGWAGFLLDIYKPLLLGKVLRSAKYVVVFTKDQQQAVHDKYKVKLNKIKIVPNGVEAVFYHSEKRIVHKEPRLLFVGRLSAQKNLPQLFESLMGISNKFQTTLVGDGELADSLHADVDRLGLTHIKFAGRADGQKLLDYYLQGDIFVLPSEREGMPLVLLEAMAMGLPIIATDVTGNREVVKDGQNGLLVPYGDAAALQSALLKLTVDTELYSRLQQNAHRMAKSYSWAKIAQEFDDLYKAKT